MKSKKGFVVLFIVVVFAFALVGVASLAETFSPTPPVAVPTPIPTEGMTWEEYNAIPTQAAPSIEDGQIELSFTYDRDYRTLGQPSRQLYTLSMSRNGVAIREQSVIAAPPEIRCFDLNWNHGSSGFYLYTLKESCSHDYIEITIKDGKNDLKAGFEFDGNKHVIVFDVYDNTLYPLNIGIAVSIFNDEMRILELVNSEPEFMRYNARIFQPVAVDSIVDTYYYSNSRPRWFVTANKDGEFNVLINGHQWDVHDTGIYYSP